ncbi:MAG: RNA methyltransferase [Halioglobus sp.]|nr:RNA methyltransferase [Halioglobus sp.]
MSERPDYNAKKSRFEKMLTVYGRKVALESLQNLNIACHTVHLARSNRETGIITEIRRSAEARGIPVRLHTRNALAHISKNSRQDQGVAVDIECPAFRALSDFIEERATDPYRLLALEGITNPQNLGMVIRSASAGKIDGIVLPSKGNAALGPLVIKASAGTIYNAPLLRCHTLPDALTLLQQAGAQVCALAPEATTSLFEHSEEMFCVYVLGNETMGISHAVNELADIRLSIPMRNSVESLNIAVTASLVAFSRYFDR